MGTIRFEKAQRLFEAGLENSVGNPYLLQAFAVMEEKRGNQANVRVEILMRARGGRVSMYCARRSCNKVTYEATDRGREEHTDRDGAF